MVYQLINVFNMKKIIISICLAFLLMNNVVIAEETVCGQKACGSLFKSDCKSTETCQWQMSILPPKLGWYCIEDVKCTDKTAPVITDIRPENYKKISESNIKGYYPIIIFFLSDDSSGIELSSLKVKVDDKILTQNTKPGIDCESEKGKLRCFDNGKLETWELFREGKHTMKIMISDKAGNLAEEISTFIVGTALSDPPIAEIVWPPSEAVFSKKERIYFVGNATDDFDSIDKLKFEWTLDGKPLITSKDDFADLPENSGEYTINLKTTDSDSLSDIKSIKIKIEDKLILFFQPINWDKSWEEFDKEVDETVKSLKENIPLVSCPGKIEVVKSHNNCKVDIKSPCMPNFNKIKVCTKASGKNFGYVIGLAQKHTSGICEKEAGFSTGGGIVYALSGSVIHELGHEWGLKDQYSYRIQKDTMDYFDKLGKSYPSKEFPNPLDPKLDCDINTCCVIALDLCRGNKARTGGGRSFMGDPNSLLTGFDENEWNHFKNNIPTLNCDGSVGGEIKETIIEEKVQKQPIIDTRYKDIVFGIVSIDKEMQNKINTTYSEAYQIMVVLQNIGESATAIIDFNINSTPTNYLICTHPSMIKGSCSVTYPRVPIILKKGENKVYINIAKELLQDKPGTYNINIGFVKALSETQIKKCKDAGIKEELCDCIEVKDSTISDREERDIKLATSEFCGTIADNYKYLERTSFGSIILTK